jgi:hypothetical protein
MAAHDDARPTTTTYLPTYLPTSHLNQLPHHTPFSRFYYLFSCRQPEVRLFCSARSRCRTTLLVKSSLCSYGPTTTPASSVEYCLRYSFFPPISASFPLILMSDRAGANSKYSHKNETVERRYIVVIYNGPASRSDLVHHSRAPHQCRGRVCLLLSLSLALLSPLRERERERRGERDVFALCASLLLLAAV